MHILKLFLLILPPVPVMDLLWLGVVMKDFYAHELGDLARRQGPRWPRPGYAAIFVYLLIPAGIVLSAWLFAGAVAATVSRSFGSGRLVWPGALWRLRPHEPGCTGEMDFAVTLADIAWGCVLCGSRSAVLMRFVDGLPRRPKHDVLRALGPGMIEHLTSQLRITNCNEAPVRADGQYVLYWMIAFRRTPLELEPRSRSRLVRQAQAAARDFRAIACRISLGQRPYPSPS